MTAEIEIVRLGALGDGIADVNGQCRYVPFALPGDRVLLADNGTPAFVSRATCDRAPPVCRHFGTCGGCVAQHMSERLYADWKRGTLAEAFHQHGLQPEIAPLLRIAPGTRRRAVLTAEVEKNGSVRLGYHQRKSHDLVDVQECPILVPDIAAQLPALRAIATAIAARELRFTVLATRTGLDVAIERNGRLGPHAIGALARITADRRLARISIRDETIVERTVPIISLSGVDVVPPPGAFVQAVEQTEQEISRLVLGAVTRSRRVADLFCGLGTFTFAIARGSRVLAVDGNQPGLAALGSAALHAQGLKPIETKRRDLFREPLSATELKGFDAAVFDPPRAGARAQAEQLARSTVPTVIAVSCDPGTMARDLRILADGGYRIESVTPLDQFLFSAHVEAVAVLRR